MSSQLFAPELASADDSKHQHAVKPTGFSLAPLYAESRHLSWTSISRLGQRPVAIRIMTDYGTAGPTWLLDRRPRATPGERHGSRAAARNLNQDLALPVARRLEGLPKGRPKAF